jgi:hypothetical protein
MHALNVFPTISANVSNFTALDKINSQPPTAASCSSDLARFQKSSLGPMSIKRFQSSLLNIALNRLDRFVD